MDLRSEKDTRQLDRHQVLMGPFRDIRMKKTAPRGIKDESDTRHVELRTESDTRHAELRIGSDTRHVEQRSGLAHLARLKGGGSR